MRVIAISIPTAPHDNSPQIAKLRELGAPESVLPTETDRQAILEQRLTPLLGFYKNCEWHPEYTRTEAEQITRYLRFQYRPTIIFRELEKLLQDGIITTYTSGTLNRQAVFTAA